jgi:hypothetical protein
VLELGGKIATLKPTRERLLLHFTDEGPPLTRDPRSCWCRASAGPP